MDVFKMSFFFLAHPVYIIILCYEFSQSTDIMLNPIKSQCMIYKPNRYKLYCPAVYLNVNIIPLFVVLR